MFNKFLKIIFIFSLLCFILAHFQKNKPPSSDRIVSDLYRDPIQVDTKREKFSFNYKDVRYNVSPVADYELWGLIVTRNDISKWYNFYHNENYVNLKDVCVVWGDNLRNDNHIGPNYKSGEWTCYIHVGTEHFISGKQFFSNKMSNNHLLSKNDKVLDVIKEMEVGDQVHLKGILVDYGTDQKGYYRQTSISRDDSNSSSRSGGACEVFYVDEAEIIKSENRAWRILEKVSFYLIWFAIVLKIVEIFYLSTKLKTRIVRIEQ